MRQRTPRAKLSVYCAAAAPGSAVRPGAVICPGWIARFNPERMISSLIHVRRFLGLGNILIMERYAMRKPPETTKSFEETYPQYRFAEIVRLGIAVAKLIERRKRRREKLFPEHNAGTRPDGDNAGTMASGSKC